MRIDLPKVPTYIHEQHRDCSCFGFSIERDDFLDNQPIELGKAFDVKVLSWIESFQLGPIDEDPQMLCSRPAHRCRAERKWGQISGQIERHEVHSFGTGSPHHGIE